MSIMSYISICYAYFLERRIGSMSCNKFRFARIPMVTVAAFADGRARSSQAINIIMTELMTNLQLRRLMDGFLTN